VTSRALAFACLLGCAGPGSREDLRYEVLLTRDSWGVPHIAGRVPADCAYALGYAQAEDRLDDLLRALHAGSGRLAELLGDDALDADRLALAFRHRAHAARDWPALPLAAQQMVDAFVRGVNDWIAEHPRALPFRGRPFDSLDVVAAHRRLLVQPEFDRALAEADGRPAPRAPGNAWAVNAARSSTGRPALLLQPAGGPSRVYEAHLRGGDLDVWGYFPVGSPFAHAGAGPGAAFALVPGGADSADAFELRLHPVDPERYEWESDFVPMDLLRVSLRVRRRGRLEVLEERLRATRHGPVVRRPNGRTFALRCSAAEHALAFAELTRLNLARGSADLRSALSLDLLSSFDAVWAGADGSIGWSRLGRVPERAPGLDASRPATGWTAIAFAETRIPFVTLPQVEDPPAGFVQACGTSPDLVSTGLRFLPDDAPSGSLGELRPAPRAFRVAELLAPDRRIDLALAQAFAFDKVIPGAAAWRSILLSAVEIAGSPPDFREAAGLLAEWDLSADRASPAASLFLSWRDAARRRPSGLLELESASASDTPEVRREALLALADALAGLRREFGRVAVPWGESHGLRRGERVWPLDGHDELTLRALAPVAFVHLGDPPVIHAVSPGGQSDDPSSPHFADQAPLFADGRWRPLPWTAAEIFARRSREQSLSGPR
jgi:acyl-homoserine lactone acylase PvdQ